MKVTVEATFEDSDRANIKLLTPIGQDPILVPHMMHVLISGVCLLIKSANSEGSDYNDYDLMKQAIEHLNTEFISNESFKDLFINPKCIKNEQN